MDNSKEAMSFRYNHTDAHVNSHTLDVTTSIGLTQFQVRQGPSSEMGKSTWASTPNKEAACS